jgi:hypothetical protein
MACFNSPVLLVAEVDCCGMPERILAGRLGNQADQLGLRPETTECSAMGSVVAAVPSASLAPHGPARTARRSDGRSDCPDRSARGCTRLAGTPSLARVLLSQRLSS